MVGNATRWSYFNVLEALLSRLPAAEYQADVAAWSRAIWELREQYEGRVPELFQQIHFVESPPAPPYSPQVSDFFVYQSFGGLKQVDNPAYQRMRISPANREEFSKRNQTLVDEYGAILGEMAQKLIEGVRV